MSPSKKNYVERNEEKEIAEVTPAVEEVEVEKIEEKVVKTGVVSGCERLNLREKPSTGAEVVTVLTRGTELVIEKEMNAKWLKVTAETGAEGFVMKEYVQ